MLPPEPTIPEGFEVRTEPDGSTVVRRRWRSWVLIPLAFFALIWNGFLVGWYSAAFSFHGAPLMMLLFPLLHVAVGVGLTYYVLASLVNVTAVTVSYSGVRVRSGPAPWFGNRTVPADAIHQVLVRERTGSRNSAPTYRLMYAGADRKERRLVDSLPQSEQAEYLAHLVRRSLRLRE